MMLLVGTIRGPKFASPLERPDMKPEIHPEYNTVKATCSCGNVIEVGSTMAEDIHLEVCAACHPFYTGKQKSIDSGGRVERFRQRFGNRGAGTKDA
mgnify:CR=1 FL=1